MEKQFSWHTKTIPELLGALRSREHGLTKEEAAKRIQEYGLNKFPEGKVDSLFLIFLRQFKSPLIYILLAAAAIVLAMGDVVDALVIMDMYDVKDNYPSVKKIILIASDSDFVPLIERMKHRGFEVIIYTYFDRKRLSKFSTSNQLLKVASRWEKLTKEIFE